METIIDLDTIFKGQQLFTLRKHLISPPVFLVGSVLLIIFSFFVLSYYVSLRSEFRVVMSVTISTWKRCSICLHLQLFVSKHVLSTLFVFACE